MKIGIIGTGLIGGSMALALRHKKLATHLIGVDANETHAQEALQRKLVDEIMPLEDAVQAADMVILAIPVDTAEIILPSVLDLVNKQVVMDVGSTKGSICNLARQHKRGKRFVATHPMWGTEFSGPSAAIEGAFEGKAVVICDAKDSDTDALFLVESIYRSLGMRLLQMDSAAHDTHAAYVSHISHITSFALANTVLEKEKEDNAIFELASGGFESTVRLAKSNPDMWVPIFMQNKENVLDVLNEHISQLKKFKACLEKENYEYLTALIQHANSIKRILK
jgi:prephenate dehydrogenase